MTLACSKRGAGSEPEAPEAPCSTSGVAHSGSRAGGHSVPAYVVSGRSSHHCVKVGQEASTRKAANADPQVTAGASCGRASLANCRLWKQALLLVALAVAVAIQPAAAEEWGTEISSTIGLFRNVDLTSGEIYKNKNASRCVHMVDRAAQGASSKINFMITHYFVDANKDLTPEYFCYKPGSSPNCVPFDQAAIDAWSTLFARCVGYAVRQGYHVSITPHLDDGLNQGAWRNSQRINPLRKYGGFSYWDTIIKPAADALAATITPNTRVWFALQGEMSAMVTAFPREHLQLIPAIKRIITASRGMPRRNIRVGVSTNFNKLCDGEVCQTRDAAVLDTPAIRRLYEACDFIGLSSYPRYKYNLTDMEDTTEQLDRELKVFGIDMQKLVNDGKELVLSEFGLGGGTGGGDIPARTVTDAQEAPWFGVYGPYTRRLDPWRTYLPVNVLSATRSYAQDWYAAAALWLKRKGGPTWRVDHVFIWNLNSWDIQGIHMESTTLEGSYRDPVASALIRAHNLEVQGLTGYDSPSGNSPY